MNSAGHGGPQTAANRPSSAILRYSDFGISFATSHSPTKGKISLSTNSRTFMRQAWWDAL